MSRKHGMSVLVEITIEDCDTMLNLFKKSSFYVILQKVVVSLQLRKLKPFFIWYLQAIELAEKVFKALITFIYVPAGNTRYQLDTR